MQLLTILKVYIQNLIRIAYKHTTTIFNKFFYLYTSSFQKIYTQYPLKLAQIYSHDDIPMVVLSIRGNRAIIRIPLEKLAINHQLIQKLHPIESCIIGLLASKAHNLKSNSLEEMIFTSKGSHKPETNNIYIKGYYKNKTGQFIAILQAKNVIKELHLPITEIINNPTIISVLPAENTCQIGAFFEEATQINSDKPRFLESATDQKNFKWLSSIFVVYCIILLTSTIFNAKLLFFYLPSSGQHLTLPSSIFIFPLTFFIQDIITEVYGFAYCRQMVWLSIIGLTIFVGYSQAIIHLPSTENLRINSAYKEAFQTLPRHFLALITALCIGSFINDFIMAKSKVMFYGRFLGFRSIFSTLIGEAIMQLVGSIIGWFGTLHFTSEILPFIIFSYGYKVLFSIATVPLTYAVCNMLKQSEGIDVYDIDTNFNPFIFKTNR